MSTLSEHTGNGNPPASSLLREDTKERIDGVLRNFDVFPSRFDRFIFRYIYIYLIGLLFLGGLLTILPIISQPQAGKVLLALGVSVLPIVVTISVLWLFNVWRKSSPKTLRELFEKKRIYIPNGDADPSYLRFLEHYRDALGSPKRYFLSGFLMITFGSLAVYGILLSPSVVHLNMFATILYVVGELLFVLSYLGGFYCGGIATWAVYISGWYVRRLMRAFELSIQPFHTDQCGGLKLLGNFCFGLGTPLLIGSGFTIGFIFIYLITASISGIDALFLALFVGFALLLLLLYAFPLIVLAFMLPLRDIHIKMMSERETDEDTYNAHIEALREEIQSLLDNNMLEEAKVLQEKKVLLETLHIPYPTWPFRIRSKIFSTILGASGSILIGMITGALPVILSLIFHNR